MKLVFLGSPGAGKGTQAAIAAERFGLEHASTGEIFRNAVSEGTELGRAVKEILDEAVDSATRDFNLDVLRPDEFSPGRLAERAAPVAVKCGAEPDPVIRRAALRSWKL